MTMAENEQTKNVNAIYVVKLFVKEVCVYCGASVVEL